MVRKTEDKSACPSVCIIDSQSEKTTAVSGFEIWYDAISDNEDNYENYLRAKFKYDAHKTATNRIKMNTALCKIDQDLFNQTRNRGAHDPVK